MCRTFVPSHVYTESQGGGKKKKKVGYTALPELHFAL